MAFERVSNEIASEIVPDARFEPEAIQGMQHASGSITLQVEDLRIVDYLCDK